MKQLLFTFIFILFCFHHIEAQSDTDYNRRGDRALQLLDYMDARMWYSEGIESCNEYSIRQLTKIWDSQASMRSGMYVLMSKCLACLERQALSDHIEAIRMLAEYYERGIGTEADVEKAELWRRRAFDILFGENIPVPTDTVEVPVVAPVEKKIPFYKDFSYFFAYSPTYTMPFGLTFGLINENRIGGYVSFRSNLSFYKTDSICNDNIIPGYGKNTQYCFDTEKKKRNYHLFTAGILFPVLKNAFMSVGMGYGKRDFFRYGYVFDDPSDIRSEEWYHNVSKSYNGLSLEVGGIYRYKNMVFSAGVNSIALKDIDVFAGVGYSF